jgi:hypothetical protein
MFRTRHTCRLDFSSPSAPTAVPQLAVGSNLFPPETARDLTGRKRLCTLSQSPRTPGGRHEKICRMAEYRTLSSALCKGGRRVSAGDIAEAARRGGGAVGPPGRRRRCARSTPRIARMSKPRKRPAPHMMRVDTGFAKGTWPKIESGMTFRRKIIPLWQEIDTAA